MANRLSSYINRLFSQMRGELAKGAVGSKSWVRNGLLHREDGPAIEGADGGKYWYRNGQLISPPAASSVPAPHP